MIGLRTIVAALSLSIFFETLVIAQLAGQPSSNPLSIVHSGQSTAMILIDPSASEPEKAAAADLQSTIEKMKSSSIKSSSLGPMDRKGLE
jgi:hypothetical protein